MELELPQLLAPDLPSNEQVNLTQMLTKCQVDLMQYCSWALDASTWRCGWGVHLTKHQSDPQADDMSCWPAVVPFLTTRCLYVVGWGNTGTEGGVGAIEESLGGYIWKMNMVYCKLLLKTQDGLLQIIEHELRSTKTQLIPLLATRCYSLGAWGVGVHLTKQQSDPQADDMSSWPAVVPLLATRCLYWDGGIGGWQGALGGYIWKMNMVYCKLLLKTQDSLLQTLEHELRSTGSKLVLVLPPDASHWGHWGVGVHLTKQQPASWADDMSCWPAVVPPLTTGYLYWWQGC